MMRRLAAGLIVGTFGLILIGPEAHAHASVRSSDPADGSRLETSPEAVTITFTEQPEPSLTTVKVLDQTGDAWQKGAPEVLEADPFTVRVAVGELAEGAYTVTWRTVSRADGHTTAGAFAFGVGVDPSAATIPTEARAREVRSPPPSVLEMGGRWSLLLGLLALLGASTVGAMVLRDPPRAVGMLAIGAWIGAAAGLAMFAEAQRRAAGTSVEGFLETRAGSAIIWRAGFIVVAGVALAAARPSRPHRIPLLVAAAAAAAALLAHVDAGHASADPSWTWAQVGAQWVHVVAAGIWLGGLAALLLGVRTMQGTTRGLAVRRFSTVAGVMLGLVIVAGVLRAVDEVETWSDLFSSGYGRLILAKIGLIAVLAGLGAINRYRNVPKSEARVSGLQRVSRFELGFAAAALLAAAALASVSPPQETPAAASEPEILAVSGSDFATSVRVRLQIAPGYAGSNEFTVRVHDYDTEEPVAADRVSLRFTFSDDPSVAPSELELKPADPGTYRREGANLSLDGYWETAVVVERGAESVEVPLEFATRCPSQELSEPGRTTVYLVELPHGLSARGYADPGTAGHNNVHLTFLEHGDSTEAHITGKPIVRAARRGDEPRELELRRLSHGHFVATSHLEAGIWRFDFEAAVGDHALKGCFEQPIRE